MVLRSHIVYGRIDYFPTTTEFKERVTVLV